MMDPDRYYGEPEDADEVRCECCRGRGTEVAEDGDDAYEVLCSECAGTGVVQTDDACHVCRERQAEWTDATGVRRCGDRWCGAAEGEAA